MSLLYLLFTLVGPEDVVRERVDVAELSHFYDDQGRLVLDQVIFYDWDPHHERFQVRAWRLVKNGAPSIERDWGSGGWDTIWLDGEILRHIKAGSFRETWPQYDPELAEREYLPKEKRRELRKSAARPR